MTIDSAVLAAHRASQQAPVQHQQEAAKLEADGIVELFEITLRSGGILRLKNNNSVTWQGNTYDPWFLKLSGVSTSVDEELSRPQLMLANLEGVFSNFVRNQFLDNAIVKRTRVLRTDIENDNPVSHTEQWRVRRVVGLNKDAITLELRVFMDGQPFQVPARMYIPPEFKMVNLR